MEYERYKSLRRPNSSCPPRLSVLFKTKLQVFLKKIAKHQEDPSIWKLFDYMESCCTLEKNHTGRKRSSEILRGMNYQTETSSDLHQLPFKTRQLWHVLLLRRIMRKASEFSWRNTCYQNLGDFLCERGKWSGPVEKRKWELKSQ